MDLVDLEKASSSHVGLMNTTIYLNESLPDIKKENFRFGGSRSEMIFFQDKGSIVITLHI